MKANEAPGATPPPDGLRRSLFFALWPDADVCAALAGEAAKLRAQASSQGRWIDPPDYHLTLRFIGDCDAAQAAAALRAGGSVQARGFDVDIDCTGSFHNRGIPWWLGCTQTPAGLQDLSDALDAQLAHAGFDARAHGPLVPHITIARDAPTILPSAAIAGVRWTVRTFLLVHSMQRHRRAYHPIARWPLLPPRSCAAGPP